MNFTRRMKRSSWRAKLEAYIEEKKLRARFSNRQGAYREFPETHFAGADRSSGHSGWS
jgi:hypothetical protein